MQQPAGHRHNEKRSRTGSNGDARTPGPLARRQDPGDAVGGVTSGVGNGGLAPSRGGGDGGGNGQTTAAAVTSNGSGNGQGSGNNGGGGSSSNNGQGDGGNGGSGSSSQNTWNQAPSSSSHWVDPNNGGNNNNNNNNNNGNNGQQWTPSTSSSQQWTAPSSSSWHDNNQQNTWDNNNGGDNSWHSTSQNNNEWHPSSSSSQNWDNGNNWEASSSSSSSSSQSSMSQNTSDSNASMPSSAASFSSTTAPVSASNGISDTSNAESKDLAASSSKSSGLATGAKAGIAVAVILLVALIAGLVLFYKRKKQREAEREGLAGTRTMSQRFSAGSSFIGGPDMSSSPSGGFITFHDNASTQTHPTLRGSPAPATPAMAQSPEMYSAATALMPRNEGPDDDDASHYDNETYDGHAHQGDLGQPARAYYSSDNRDSSNPYDGMAAPYSNSYSPRMPEYNIPTPPLPAFDSEEAILSSRSSMANMAYVRPNVARSHSDSERRALNASTASQRSYVDDQLRELYVDHY